MPALQESKILRVARDLISVVMPVRNEALEISGAIASVLWQTDSEWELLIVDDSSTDGTLQRAEEFDDDRIRIVPSCGTGIVDALNTGLSLAEGTFVARFDADDRMVPCRLEHQRWRFERDSKLGVLSSWSRSRLDGSLVRSPVSHELIGAFLRHGNCVSHPTVMFHRGRITSELEYDRSMESVEDYALWLRLYFDEGVRFGGSPKPLLHQKIQTSQVTVNLRLEKAREMLRERQVGGEPCSTDRHSKVFIPWIDLRSSERVSKRLLLMRHIWSEIRVHARDPMWQQCGNDSRAFSV